jgi:hypothetical protein
VTIVGTRGERVGGKGSPSNVIAEDEEERRRAVLTRDRKGENGSEGRHIQDAGWWLCDVVHSRFSNTHCAVDQHRLSAQKAVPPEYRASGRGSLLK